MKVTLVWFMLTLLWSSTILGVHTLPVQDTDSEILSLRNEVIQLKQALASLQAQSNIQDQKYAAILSSVLSSMSSLKDANNLTRNQLSSVVSTIASIENHHNSTVLELDNVKNQLNMSAADLNDLKSQLSTIGNTTFKLSELSSLKMELDDLDVSFEALLETGYTIKNKDKIIFDSVTLNKGASYDPVSGVFTAPVPGTYMFWAHVLQVRKGISKAMYVDIYSTKGLLSRGYARVTENLVYNAVTPIAVTLLNRGEKVWFKVSLGADSAVLMGDKDTSCGGTLLHVNHSLDTNYASRDVI